MTARFELHGFAFSGPTYKVALMLSLMDEPFDYVHVNMMAGEHKQPPHMSRQRYGQVPEKVASVIMIFAFTILLAGNMVACGFLLERFAGIPYAFGVIIAVLLVLAYTVGGGLFSDAYTAAIQTTITVVATIAMLIWAVASIWVLYRVIRGYLLFKDSRPIPGM